MIFSDTTIRERQASDGMLDPFVEANVQPASVDLTLGNDFILFDERLTPDEGEPVLLERHRFALATTAETVKVPVDVAAQVAGKSSWARRGLLIHVTAGWIDPGFEGQITLELKNLGDHALALYPGTPICQIYFMGLTVPAAVPYGSEQLGSHYQGQTGTTRAWHDPHVDMEGA